MFWNNFIITGKLQKWYIEFLYPHTHLPLILTSNITVELFNKTEKFTLVQYHFFLTNVVSLFLNTILDLTLHLGGMSPWSSTLCVTVPQSILIIIIHDSDIFKNTAQIFCRMFVNLGSCYVFSCLDSGYGWCGKNNIEVNTLLLVSYWGGGCYRQLLAATGNCFLPIALPFLSC